MRTHLTVIQPVVQPGKDPTQVLSVCNPIRQEIRWNDDFTSFQVLDLLWWDDASYIRYQCGDY